MRYRHVLYGMTALAFASAVSAAPKARRASCEGIQVHSTPPLPSDAAVPRFPVKKTLDVNFTVLFAPGRPFRQLDGLALRIFTPHGFLYQELSVPIAADGQRERLRRLPDRRFPAKVAHARSHRHRGKAFRGVDTPPLMVAGTDILANSLFGTWRVEVLPQGAASTCSASFVLAP